MKFITKVSNTHGSETKNCPKELTHMCSYSPDSVITVTGVFIHRSICLQMVQLSAFTYILVNHMQPLLFLT